MLVTLLDSMSRRFRADQVNIIKATSTSNNLIQPVLNEHAGHKAVLLYLPLESYLAAMLGKQRQASDLWMQGRKRMLDWMGIDGTANLNSTSCRPRSLQRNPGLPACTICWLRMSSLAAAP